MSASSSAASSSTLRSQRAVLFLAGLATAWTLYYIYTSSPNDIDPDINSDTNELPSGLHRSNAIRQRQRLRAEDEELQRQNTERATIPLIDHEASRVARQALAQTDGETLLDDNDFQDDFSFAEGPEDTERIGQNIVQLLFRVSEDATRRDAYVHRGCACNSCNVVPIKGIRYRCANCADYDLCEGCESQGVHTKTHIFYKVRVPAPSHVSRHVQPVWYSGDPEASLKVLPKELVTKLSMETGFERPQLDAYWEQWTFMANTHWRDDPDGLELAMDRPTFERCLVPSGAWRNSAASLIYDRMFAFYDTNKDDMISFSEFLHGVAHRRKKDKWARIFEGYDIDGDGYIDRRDCLRIFRSYYVLYREMHRDMLEGVENQQMGTPEVHRLVHSRQPLSSAFGQDGRYPDARERPITGKARDRSGDLDITDDRGVVAASNNDTGDREDIFRMSLWIPGQNPFPFTENTAVYWDTLLNPPLTIDEMPVILENISNLDSRSDGGVPDIENSRPYISNVWPPRFVQVTPGDIETVLGPGYRMETVPTMRRHAVTAQAVRRELARREIHERWKRRQFYTDEEEGATQPDDWDDEEDILGPSPHVTNGESSKSQEKSHLTAHSRSSSKVRFAEDIDDFDTRSNPSTSSRSIPERWGGVEISGAERDAGKEILYQVAQQSYIELLDRLFKDKEDLAEKAAKGKIRRDLCRKLFTLPEYETYFVKRAADEAGDMVCESEADDGFNVPTDTYRGDLQNSADWDFSHAPGYHLEDHLDEYHPSSMHGDLVPNNDNEDNIWAIASASNVPPTVDTTNSFRHEAMSDTTNPAEISSFNLRGTLDEARARRYAQQFETAYDQTLDEARHTVPELDTHWPANLSNNGLAALEGEELQLATNTVHQGILNPESPLHNPEAVCQAATPRSALEELWESPAGFGNDTTREVVGGLEGRGVIPSSLRRSVRPQVEIHVYEDLDANEDETLALHAPHEIPISPVLGTREAAASVPIVTSATPEDSCPPYRDPTMPQFRPNSNADIQGPHTPEIQRPLIDPCLINGSETAPPPSLQALPFSPTTSKPRIEDALRAILDTNSPADITSIHALAAGDRNELFAHWKMEKEVREAEYRGGWGRMNVGEFVEACDSGKKDFTVHGSGTNKGMEYMGSWIEFCIP